MAIAVNGPYLGFQGLRPLNKFITICFQFGLATDFRSAVGDTIMSTEKQAISNILENAVKYADGDSTIIIRAAEEEEYVGCGIISEGIPIGDKEAAKVFQRNYRGEAAKQKVPAGTGIGLYLVFRIIGIHKGKIKVYPNDKITEFVILFPKTNLIR